MSTALASKHRRAAPVLTLIIVAVLAGCSGGARSASPARIGTATSVSAPAAPVTSAATAAAASSSLSPGPVAGPSTDSQVGSVDTQLKSLDRELATSDSGLDTQEGDPTK